MDWKRYSLAFGVFGIINVVVLYFALRSQAWFPWFFPNVMTTPMTPDLAANTAVSFATTTTWQAYAGETTMSHFSQLCSQGKTSAGTFMVDQHSGGSSTRGAGNSGAICSRYSGCYGSCRQRAVCFWWRPSDSPVDYGTRWKAGRDHSPRLDAVLEFIKNLGINGGGFLTSTLRIHSRIRRH
jgi:hypothetical protein